MSKTKKDKFELKQTLVEHLVELRKRLVICAVFLVIFAALCFRFSEFIAKNMLTKSPDTNFVFIEPAELFMSYIKISLICGLILALPFILFNIWMFLKPGLDKSERGVITFSLFLGGILFALGGLFGYLIVLPMTLSFFATYEMNEIQSMISFSSYLSFTTTTVLSFGIVFELPIFMVIMVKLRILKTSVLKKNRKIVILLIFIVAAILTPPDVINQIMLAVPMLLLFEIGIFFSKLVEPKAVKK